MLQTNNLFPYSSGVPMCADTSNLLDNEDLQNISRSYALAFLRTKGIEHVNFEPAIDNHWNFGPFEEGLLIRTNNNSLFSSFTWPEMTNSDEDTEAQTIGNSVQEKFLDLVAHLIANKQAAFPTRKVELAFYVNHNRGHHTCLLVNFQGIDQAQYQELYKAYQEHSAETGIDMDEEGQEKELIVRRNNVRNFLMSNRNIFLTHQDRETKERVLSNWVLPLEVAKINFRHFDSLGVRSRFHDAVQDACEDFVANHQATFRRTKAARQQGNTCGDWSVYNSFRYAALNRNQKLPRSQELRTLTENKSVENANEILFKTKRKFEKVALEDQINVAADQFPEEYEEIAAHSPPSKLEKLINPAIVYNELNNRWPFFQVMGYVYVGIATFVAMNAIMPGLALGTMAGFGLTMAAIVGTAGLFNIFLKGFFGEKKLSFQLDKEREPVVKSISLSGGVGNLLGIDLPYHNTLSALEAELASLLCANNKDTAAQNQDVDVTMIHQYAKKVINAFPDYFYDEDRLQVNEPEYAPAKLKAS